MSSFQPNQEHTLNGPRFILLAPFLCGTRDMVGSPGNPVISVQLRAADSTLALFFRLAHLLESSRELCTHTPVCTAVAPHHQDPRGLFMLASSLLIMSIFLLNNFLVMSLLNVFLSVSLYIMLCCVILYYII